MKKKSVPTELPIRLNNEVAVNVPTTEQFTSVKHSINLGDLYGAMGAIKKYYDITKRKVRIYQFLNQLANYYAGAEHPTKNETGAAVCMNSTMFDMVKPLIESQEYIESFQKYEGQKIDLDFDVIRSKTFVNLPHGSLQGWIPLAFPDLTFDLSKAWITLNGKCPEHIKKQVNRKVILNFTERYRNGTIDYFFLKNYAPDLIFSGTEKEHWLFCSRWGLDIPRLEVSNFLELAYALREARFLLCNQSMQLNLSQAMKTTHIFEICSFAQNVMHMINDNSFGFLHQVGVEYYFRRLYNETMIAPKR